MENATISFHPANFSLHTLFATTAASILANSDTPPAIITAGAAPPLPSTSLGTTLNSTSTEDNSGGNPNVAPQTSLTDTIEILIYTICLCIGGPLNLISFRKLSRHFISTKNVPKNCATHVTLLKLNLNIADLLTMFVYTLSQIIWMISYQWYAGDLLCRICKFFHTFGFYLNSFVVACFALDRAFSTYNLQMLNSSQAAQMRVKRMLTVAWISAFLLSLPQSFIFRVVEPPEMKDFKQCTPIWTILGYEIDLEIGRLMKANLLTESYKNELMERFTKVVLWERTYNIAHLLFVFWIPTLIIIGSYVTMLCVLNSFSVPKSFKSRMSLKRTIRVTKTSPCSKYLEKTTVLDDIKEIEPNVMVLSHQGSADSGIHDERDLDSAPLKSNNSQQTADGVGVTPRNSVTSATATTFNGTTESECSRQKLSASSMGNDNAANGNVKIASKHSSLKCNNSNASATKGNNRNITSISSPPSIKFEEDAGDEPRRSSIAAEKSSSSSCPVKLPLLNMSKAGNNSSSVGNMALRRIAKARQKTKRQAALILVAYLTIWTPYNLLAMLNAFSSHDGVVKKVASVTLPFLNSMIVMNPIVNPLIYGLYEGRRSSIS